MSAEHQIRNNYHVRCVNWLLTTVADATSEEKKRELNAFVKETLESRPGGDSLATGFFAQREVKDALAANNNILPIFCDLYPLDDLGISLESACDKVCQDRNKQLMILKNVFLKQLATHPELSSLQQVGNDSKAIFEWLQANILVLESVTKLQGNFFWMMPPEICLFKNLQDLLLSQSMIKKLSRIIFANLPQLRLLDLSMNSLESIPEDVFTSLSQLQRLNLSYNPITNIAKGSFQGLSQLKYLHISHTAYKSLDPSLTISEGAFENLSGLKYLYLTANKMYKFSAPMFTGLSALEHLDLSDNMYIEGDYNLALPDRTFADLSNLKYLNLSRNLIDTISSETFAGLSALEHLDLSFTRILTIQNGAFSHLTHLIHLLLCVEKITAISTQTFAGLSQVKQLRLDQYRQGDRSLSTGIFSELPALQLLQLRSFYGNTIKIPPGTFTGLTHVVGFECNGDYNGKLQLAVATETLHELEGLEQLFLKHCTITM